MGSNKQNTIKILAFLFFVILASWLWTQYKGEDREGTLPVNQINIDTNNISSISIIPEFDDSREIYLRNFNGEWQVRTAEGDYAVIEREIRDNTMLHLGRLTPEFLLATGRDAHSEFEVDGQGTQVIIRHKNDRKVELILGTYMFRKGEVISAFRLPDDDRVFGINEYFNATLSETDREVWKGADVSQ